MHDNGNPFQTGAGIDIFLFQRRIRSILFAVKLSKYKVPKLNIAVTVTAYVTVGIITGEFRTAVIENFRTWSAGSGSVLPEIILIEATYAFCRYSDFIVPDVVCFIIIAVYCDQKPLHRHFQPFCNKFPGPGDGFALEIVTERKVTQHLKIGAMSVGYTHILYIRRTNAFLTAGNTFARWRGRSRKPILHWGHTCINQQN